MLFSIIIPVYNVEKYLSACLDSVLGQTFPNWEAICVNDGSSDGSCAILEKYSQKDPRFMIVSKENGGLSSARNAGIYEAKGDYILFLDSDDWLEPIALSKLSESIGGEDLVCFNGRRFFEESSQFEDADTLLPKSYAYGMEYYSENALLHRRFAFVCVVLRCYRREYLTSSNLLFKPGIYHEDNLFTPLACYYSKEVKVIPDVLYNYRLRKSSIMTSRGLKHWKDMISIANDLAAFFIHKKDINKTTIYRAITHHYQMSFTNVSKKDRKEIRGLCNWGHYHTVSRTKIRHIVNYWVNWLYSL